MTSAARLSCAELRFDILGHRIQIGTRSTVVNQLVRGLYRNYADNSTAEPQTRLEIKSFRRNGNRLWTLAIESEEVVSHRRLGPVLNQLEYEICRRVIEQRRDRIMLHGALVSHSGTALFIAGPSGAGKSTLSVALSAYGFRVETDDIALLDTSSAAVNPIPRCFHLDSRSKRLLRAAGLEFQASAARNNFITPADLENGAAPCLNPDILIFLSRTASNSPTFTPVTQAEMAGLLLHESAWGRHSAAEALSALVRLTRNARCYKLVMGGLQASAQVLHELVCSRQTSSA